jgi:ABC-type dipeptide/oligopeptide/nickel transport system ATPase subunit
MLDPLTQPQIWHVLLDRGPQTGLGLLAVAHDDALLHAVTDRVLSTANLA